MSAVRKYARFLELFSMVIVIPLMIIAYCYKWLQPAVPVYNDIADGAKQVRLYAGVLFGTHDHVCWLPSPCLARIFGGLVDAFSLILFCWGAYHFIRLLRCYRNGELFTQKTIYHFVLLSRIAFAWTLYNPIKLMLLTVITSCFNPAGQRTIAIGVTAGDIVNIFMVGLFFVIASLMQEAARLQDEHDLTV
jgi:hypothetical protein